MLWLHWWHIVRELRGVCPRQRTFCWLVIVLIGMTIRTDLFGVTSIVRALGLMPVCYDRLLDFFHSPALALDTLTTAWRRLVFTYHPGIMRVHGRPVLIGDGIKVGKAGKHMPAVKKLHQESATNNKAEYIFGHSCQAIAVCANALASVVALPLTCRIHEGLIFSNRDKRTLLDKMILLLNALGIPEPWYFVADAYYASGKIVRGLLAKGNHLVTRVKRNAVAYLPPAPSATPKRRGRPKKYGDKIKLTSLLHDDDAFVKAQSPIYGETAVTLRYRVADMLWRPIGDLIRFVVVVHPTRGVIFLMSTDLSLTAMEIIGIYALRFKIEVTFKQALHTIGAFAYHFWMAMMTPIGRKSGNQYLHRKTAAYRNAVRRKMDAYHRHIQLGLIAQGVLHILAATVPTLIWRSFGSWLRTIRPGLAPSELVVANALRNTLPQFLAASDEADNFKKFLTKRIDAQRMEGSKLIA